MTLRPGPTTGHKPLSVSRQPTIGIGIRTYEILHLEQRIPDKSTLVREVTAWTHDRNVQQSIIDWRFTTPDTRIKLKRLYPAILP